MPVVSIIEYPSPLLTTLCKPVDRFDEDLQQLIDNMTDTLLALNAIGLSAPQVADLRRVLVVDVPGATTGPCVYINPQILNAAKPGFVQESCLSLPGVVGSVMRHTELTVTAVDRSGNQFREEVSGMHAVSIQHELDHLDGKLFIDRLTLLSKLRLKLSRKGNQMLKQHSSSQH